MASMTFKHYTQSYGANTQASHWQAYQHTFAFNRPHTHTARDQVEFKTPTQDGLKVEGSLKVGLGVRYYTD